MCMINKCDMLLLPTTREYRQEVLTYIGIRGCQLSIDPVMDDAEAFLPLWKSAALKLVGVIFQLLA